MCEDGKACDARQQLETIILRKIFQRCNPPAGTPVVKVADLDGGFIGLLGVDGTKYIVHKDDGELTPAPRDVAEAATKQVKEAAQALN